MKYRWVCWNCDYQFRSHEDEEDCPRCGGVLYPCINERRVHGDHYLPYRGSGRWQRMANAALAEIARDNWLKRR
jgi:rubredoxin